MKVLLDTNLWRYIAEAEAGDELLRASIEGKARVVVVPAIVYETLATSEEVLRGAILALLAKKSWVRTMPEAFLESRELLAEIEHFHPGWLSNSPDLREYKFQLADWKRDRPTAHTPRKRGFWGRLRADTGFMNASSKFPLMEEARAQSKAARETVARQGNVEFPPLAEALYAPTLPGGRKGPVAEGWRWAGYLAWRVHLSMPGSPHEAWFVPFFRGRPWQDDAARWMEFWLEGARREALPRTWLRWACEYLQQGQKWSPGTPGDAQLSSHLVDADYFLSADKRLVTAFAEIASAGLVRTAEPCRTRGGREGVEDVLSFLGGRSPLVAGQGGA